MIRLCFLYYLFLLIIGYVQCQTIDCPSCEPDKCTAVLNCQNGFILDECNCCQVCGKGENEVCNNYNLKCATAFNCNYTAAGNEVGISQGSTFNVTGICVKKQNLATSPEMENQPPKSPLKGMNDSEPNMTGSKQGSDNNMGDRNHNDVTTERNTNIVQDKQNPPEGNSAEYHYLKASALLCCLLMSTLLH